MKWFLAFGLGFLVISAIGMLLQARRRAFIAWIREGETAIENEPMAADPNSAMLPPIIQSYLHKVLPPSMPAIHHVRLLQSGFMALQEGPADKPFTAEQIISIGRPAFSWTAQLTMAPLTKVQVCDRLIGFEGFLQARLANVLTLAHEAGRDLLKGEILRYLAELPWAPWGFLYLQNAVWTEVTPKLWQLSLVHEGIPVHILYQFDEQALIASIQVDDRPRSIGHGCSLPTTWQGRFIDYTVYGGVLLPKQAEVSWLLKEGKETFTYFRAQIDQYTIIQ